MNGCYLLLQQTDSIKNQGILGIRSSQHNNDARTLTFTFFITCHHSNQEKEDVVEDISNKSEDKESDTDESKVLSSLHKDMISKDNYCLKWFNINEIVDYQKSDKKKVSNEARGWACQIYAQGKRIEYNKFCILIGCTTMGLLMISYLTIAFTSTYIVISNRLL